MLKLLNITGAFFGNWSSTPVTLRVYPDPKSGGFLSSSCSMKLAPVTGLAPACSSLKGMRLDSFVFTGIETGTSGWTRTITVPLNRRMDYYYPTLVETGGRDGCCPRSILLDRQANMLLLLTSFLKLGGSQGLSP